ncbi:MAG: aminotransferase class V-fold PLP-dependent enzyme, partial [Zetaproteobacteria bacterium]
VPDVVIFGEGAPRVGNVSMFGVPGMDGETLLMQLDLAGFAVSAGSACASGKHEPSYVLAAMRAPKAAARGAIRVSLGPGVEEAHLEALVRTIADARARLAAMAGQW